VKCCLGFPVRTIPVLKPIGISCSSSARPHSPDIYLSLHTQVVQYIRWYAFLRGGLAGQEYLLVTYRELEADFRGSMSRVTAWLGVDASFAYTPGRTKQMLRPLEEIFRNMGECAAALQEHGIPLEPTFDETSKLAKASTGARPTWSQRGRTATGRGARWQGVQRNGRATGIGNEQMNRNISDSALVGRVGGAGVASRPRRNVTFEGAGRVPHQAVR